jgi:hypothetical protein
VAAFETYKTYCEAIQLRKGNFICKIDPLKKIVIYLNFKAERESNTITLVYNGFLI